MNVNQAVKIIIKPHITEKTFEMVQRDGKICFIVDRAATKPQIVEAINVLYKYNVLNVNTARTIYGKKAFVKFESIEKATNLATDIGML